MGRKEEAFILGAEPLPDSPRQAEPEGREGEAPAAPARRRAPIYGAVLAGALAALGALVLAIARPGGEAARAPEPVAPASAPRPAVLAPISERLPETAHEPKRRKSPNRRGPRRLRQGSADSAKRRIEESATPVPASELAPVPAPLDPAPASPPAPPDPPIHPAPASSIAPAEDLGGRPEFSFER